jgi:hypothetical protein
VSSVSIRLLGVVFLFVLIFVSGFWLVSSGKPYSAVLLAVHKLMSVGLVVLMVVTILNINRQNPLAPEVFILSLFAGLFFLAAIISGGLLSMDKTMPSFVLLLHRITPFITILAVTVVFYLIFDRK